jgi:hypothetical protein
VKCEIWDGSKGCQHSDWPIQISLAGQLFARTVACTNTKPKILGEKQNVSQVSPALHQDTRSSMAESAVRKSIVFVHPDLGIGGAERLVIDAAVGLQSCGHKVTILTSYRDKNHCFDEARDGRCFSVPLPT